MAYSAVHEKSRCVIEANGYLVYDRSTKSSIKHLIKLRLLLMQIQAYVGFIVTTVTTFPSFSLVKVTARGELAV